MASRGASKNVRQPDERAYAPADSEGRVLRRGLQLLTQLQQAGDEGLRVVDLCLACGLQRAPVHRLLATLIDCGWVQRLGRFRYLPNVQLGGLPGLPRSSPPQRGAGPPQPAELAQRLAPLLARISRGCGDAAFAVVREGHTAWCVARHVGTYPVQMLAVQVGNRQPMGVGAAGLALLSALPKDEADAAIASYGEVLPRYGGMTPSRLQLLVRTTRERGWSVVGNHAVKNVMGVGIAVPGPDGLPLAGISVAAAMDRMTRTRQRQIAELMRAALDAGW